MLHRTAIYTLVIPLAAMTVLTSSARAEKPPPEAVALAEEWLANPATKSPSIAIAAFNHDGIVWSGGFGFANVENQIAATATTRYHFASITKVHTTLLLVQMQAEGKLDVDDPVIKHLPGFVPKYREPGARPITLRDLATHTSGLPNWWGKPSSSPTDTELLEWLRNSAIAIQPGLQYKYSNHGFAALGTALARTEGKPYEAMVRERILVPLKMNSSGFEELYDAPDLARAYGPDGSPHGRSKSFNAQCPASGLVSTVEDIARFGIAHLSRDPGGVIPPRLQERLFTLQGRTGLGWQYSAGGGFPHWWHLGAWGWHYTRILLRTDIGAGVVFATNGPWDDNPGGGLLKLLAPIADTSDLEAVCGEYEDDEGQVIVRLPPGPEMTLEIEGEGRLLPISLHTFRLPGKRNTATSVRFVDENDEKVMLWENRRLIRKKQ
jgi:CubicO group peptidase (beta-lactamase class C family)